MKYSYSIEITESREEIIAFHWERAQTGVVPYPHIHCGFAAGGDAPITRKTHVPSGRVALEDVVYFVISELNVPPRMEGWQEIVAATRSAFLSYKTAE